MNKYIISYNTGYGDTFECIESENKDNALKYAYECWKDEAENQAEYSVVGISTKKLREECGM